MSTATPTTRPSSPMPMRAAAPSGAGAATTLDPVKLVKKYMIVLIIAGIVGVGVGLGSYLILLKYKKLYSASTIFQVDPPRRSVIDSGDGDINKDELERVMATEAQAILSHQVLQRAVRDPALRSQAPVWSSDFLDASGRLIESDAILELQETMVARPVPNTIYIEVKFTYGLKQDTYTVVNVVSDAYERYLREKTANEQAPIRSQLVTRIKQLQDQIDRAQNSSQRLIIENGIESVDAKLTEAGEKLDLAVGDRAAVQERITLLETQMEEYQNALNDLTGFVIPNDIRQQVQASPLIQQLQSQLQATRARLRSLERLGFGPEHPSIKVVQADIDGLEEEIASQTSVLQEQYFDSAISQIRVALSQSRAQESELTDRITEAQVRLTEIARIGQEVSALQRSISQLQTRLSEAEADLDEVDGLLKVAEQGRVTLFQQAQLPEVVSFPKWHVVIPAGFMLVMGITGTLIVLREILDQRVKGPSDIAMIPRTPVLGMLPDVNEDPSRPERAESAFHDRPGGVFAEGVRQLRVAMVSKIQQAGHRSVLIVPASPQSGATTIVTNIAEAASRADTRVLVLDANLRRPAIHKLYNLDAAPGLADVLAHKCDIDEALCKTDNPSLDVMTVGSPEHRVFESISTANMSETLARLESRYDLILIDVAPALVAGDALGIANRVGATVLVARAMVEKRGLIARLKNDLSGTRAEFLGVIVNGVRSSAGGYFKRNMRASHAYQNKKTASADA